MNLLLPLLALASVPKNADLLCTQLLQEKPSLASYEATFTKSFRDKVPLAALESAFAGIFADTGACLSLTAESTGPNRFLLSLNGEKELTAQLTLSVEPGTGLFSGLLLESVVDPQIQVSSWSDVAAAFHYLSPNGNLGATLVTADRSVNLSHAADSVFAIGSTFKLYILGALELAAEAGRLSWTDKLTMRDEWISLGEGGFNDLPAGTTATLNEYAASMISLSDNTATDHLLGFLGKPAVEAMLAPMGNAEGNLPFLSTLEMFKLKWGAPPSLAQEYLGADVSRRRAILDSLKAIPRSDVGNNGVNSELPTLIDRLEWFATTGENCGAMFWLASRSSSQVRAILAKNVPFVHAGEADSHWAYAGYKGGSEPGVLSMTLLLESKAGTRACVSMSWNDSEKPVDEARFQDLVKKTVKYAETVIP